MNEYGVYIIENKEDNNFVILSSNRNYEPILAYGTTNEFSTNFRENESLCFWLKETTALLSDITYTEEEKTINQVKWDKLLNKKEKHIQKTRVSRTADCNVDFETAAEQARNEWSDNGWLFYRPEEYPGVLSQQIQNELSEIQNLPPDYVTGQSIYDYTYIVTWTDEYNAVVDPVVTSKWGQQNPYNSALVQRYPNVTALGCSTIALGQIVRYHKWIAGYDYSRMPDILTYNNTTLPDFLLHIGELLEIDYANGQSYASGNQIVNACKKIGYSPTLSTFTFDPKSTELPMIILGSLLNDPQNGHVWVCDGLKRNTSNQHIYIMIPCEHPEDAMYGGAAYIPYNGKSDGYIETYYRNYSHFNWGWNGKYDGWYYNAANPGNETYTNLKKITLKNK